MYPFTSLLGDFGRFFCRKVNFWSLLPVTRVEIVQFTGWCYTLRERSVVIVQHIQMRIRRHRRLTRPSYISLTYFSLDIYD